MAIVENQEKILQLANNIGDDLSIELFKKIQIIESEDPAEFVYLGGHSLAAMMAHTIGRLEDYEKIYGINFDRDKRLAWLNEIIKTHLKYFTA